jgi:hypothetical protein
MWEMAEEREIDKERMLEILDRLSPLNVFPPETRSHLRAAQKEMLLACRSLVDAAIQCVEEAEKPKAKKRTKIEVQ